MVSGTRNTETQSVDTFYRWLEDREHVNAEIPVDLWVSDTPTDAEDAEDAVERIADRDAYERYAPEFAKPEQHGIAAYVPSFSPPSMGDVLETVDVTGVPDATVSLENTPGDVAATELRQFDDHWEVQPPTVTTTTVADNQKHAVTVPVQHRESEEYREILLETGGGEEIDLLDSTIGRFARAAESAHDTFRRYVSMAGKDHSSIDMDRAVDLLEYTDTVTGTTAGMYGIRRNIPLYFVDPASHTLDDPVDNLFSTSRWNGKQAAQSLYTFDEVYSIEDVTASVTLQEDGLDYRIETELTVDELSPGRERMFTVPVVFTGETDYDALPTETQEYLDTFDGVETKQPQASDYLPVLDP